VLASTGLFALVFGFSRAELSGWTAALTIGSLAAGVALLAAFVMIERRVEHPLLPLRVVTDRNRGASFISMGLASAAMFGVFLFLTYYLQDTLGYSPVTTGLAFMPLTAVLMVTSVVSTTRLRGIFGPRPLVFAGMALGAVAMLMLRGIGAHSDYVGSILPSLLVMGVGLGLVFSNAMNSATLGIRPLDAGVASATVNAAQQVGGSLGTALLSTLAASATTSFIAGQQPTAALIAHAAIHGYTTAFGISAAIFAVGAVVAGSLFAGKRGQPAAAGELVPVA